VAVLATVMFVMVGMVVVLVVLVVKTAVKTAVEALVAEALVALVAEDLVDETAGGMEEGSWGTHLAETAAVSDLVGLVGLVGLEARWESAVRVASRGMEAAKAQEESEEVAMAVEGLVARVA